MKIPVSSKAPVLAVVILLLCGCVPAATSVPPTVPQETTASATTPPTVTQEAAAASATTPPTPTPDSSDEPSPGWQNYTNSTFGLSFQFPSTWYGPDVYEVDNVVRLAVGSDVVYPYGSDPINQISAKNSYSIVIQYTQNINNWTPEQYRENQPWIETHLSVLDLEDGESISTARSLTIRVRELKLGNFTGVEYIGTLSESAQTEYVYIRNVFLFDEHLNLLLITASPQNVDVRDPANWREAFQSIDEANQEVLYHLLESIQVE